MHSPLCVCHFQEILGEPQVKISKRLGYLRARGMVETKQEKNWIIYSLPEKRDAELTANLKCLQDCAQNEPVFKRDLKKLAALSSKPCAPGGILASLKKMRKGSMPFPDGAKKFEVPSRGKANSARLGAKGEANRKLIARA